MAQELNMAKKKKNPHAGSTFESFLKEEGIYEEVTAGAMKRVLAWQIAQAMKKQHVTKSTMAKRMKTSRAALDRLLDAQNTSVTLQTMGRAAAVLGKELSITLKDAA
jgi:antitoxin HicB